ncbi:hypothetical protein BpHYR1_034204 [Brachionus plicatilis]|uniref:Uncharacterized protein n=1 Tax=Brachionus plicatilis TaxID=10195 RepID=A0A3M7SML5_BRAPC|nr:hypothetical protein BpHYR1_034204 [Brachionus plicatilis]
MVLNSVSFMLRGICPTNILIASGSGSLTLDSTCSPWLCSCGTTARLELAQDNEDDDVDELA